MIPGLDMLGGGGLSGSSAATASTGSVTLGGFNFSPKASVLPPVAWIALAVVAAVFLLNRGR